MTLREAIGTTVDEPLLEARSGRRPLSASSQPLSADELSRAGYLAGRLFAELHTAIEAVPSAERGARAMARFLGVDQNIPQRVVRAVQGGDASTEFLTRLPGSATLRRFIKAVARKSAGRFDSEAALVAIDQFDTLVRELAGSQSRLAARIRASANDPHQGSVQDPQLAERVRRRMFDGAVDTMHLSVDTQALICVLGRTSKSELLDLAAISTSVGLEVGPSAMPIVAGSALYESPEAKEAAEPEFIELEEDFTTATRFKALVPEFSSRPLPALVTQRETRSLLQIIEPPNGRPGKFDVALGNRVTSLANPVGQPQPHIVLGTRVRLPTKRLIYTAYLHQSLAAACTPSLASYFWSPQSAANPLDVWYNRLPSHGTLELLGAGLGQAATPAWSRMAEQCSFVFQRLGWSPREFVGYRFSITYPYWGAGYNLLLDFGGRALEEEASNRAPYTRGMA